MIDKVYNKNGSEGNLSLTEIKNKFGSGNFDQTFDKFNTEFLKIQENAKIED